jgi:hypothetical protein
MRKPVVIALVAAIVLLLGAAGALYQKYRQTTVEFAAMKAEEETTRARYSAAINSIAAIQDSLNAIVLGDAAVGLTIEQQQAEHRLSESQGDEILGRIAVLKAGLERTKSRIEQLDSALKKSGIKIAGLERMISGLKRTVAEKEQSVMQLTARVDELQTAVAGLTVEVEQGHQQIQAQATTIEEKRRELGTIYYLIGTKKDLTTAGAVVAKGGVLGMGKTLQPSGQVNEGLFTALDTDQQTTVRIPAAKAQVLSAQPVSSYVLETVGDQTELRIVDPSAFRKVKHLVIMTT